MHLGPTGSRRYRGGREGGFLFVGGEATDGRVAAVQLSAPAVNGLARTLANEFAPSGITVNDTCPGYAHTARLDILAKSISTRSNVKPGEVFAGWARDIPAGRIGTPEEFAAVVVFLASQRASCVNGTSIAVDGGLVRSLL